MIIITNNLGVYVKMRELYHATPQVHNIVYGHKLLNKNVHDILFPKNKAIERLSGYEEISICPLDRLWRLEGPAWLLPVAVSLPVEVGLVGIQGASWSHSEVICSIEHSIEHLAVRHYALHLKCYFFTYTAVTPTQGIADEFYDYRTTAMHHLVRLPILRYTICLLLCVWL